MLDIFADVVEKDNQFNIIEQVMKELENTHVLVGIPEDKTARKDGKITNAGLMYIHSHGSPANNIPPRPIIEPALENNKERLGQVMGEAVKAAMAGDSASMRHNLDKAGLAGQNAAKSYMNDPANGVAPLAESTLEQRNRKALKASNAEKQVKFTTGDGKNVSFTANKGQQLVSNPIPLIDTTELRDSITYVVREKS